MSSSLHNVVQLQAQYHKWATTEMLRGIATLPEGELTRPRGTSFDNLQATLTHMFLADRVWMDRLLGNKNAQMASTAAPSSTHLEEEWMGALNELCAWITPLGAEDVAMSVAYLNSAGVSFTTPVWQIVLHVVNHGTGHRGQVNGLIRQAGGRPNNTDLIQFYRMQQG